MKRPEPVTEIQDTVSKIDEMESPTPLPYSEDVAMALYGEDDISPKLAPESCDCSQSVTADSADELLEEKNRFVFDLSDRLLSYTVWVMCY